MFKKASSSRQLSLFQFSWYGFNIISGSLGFAGNFYPTAMPSFDGSDGKITSTTNNPHSIGLNVMWVMLVTGLVALGAALAFTKLARVCRLRKNGFIYACTRTGFGRLAGFVVGAVVYVSLPFVITIQILFFCRGFFGGGFIGHYDSRFVAKWGAFTNLWLDLISVTIYLGVGLTVFLGIRVFKRLNNFCTFTSQFFSLIFIAIYFLFFVKFAHKSFLWWNTTPHQNAQGGLVGGGNTFHFSGIFYAFNVFFFSFTGFELFASAGRNVVNPERNLGRGVKIAMFSAIAWYLFFTVVFFGTYWGDAGSNDADHGYAFQQNNVINFFGRKVIGGIGSVFYYIGIFVKIFLEGLFVVRMGSENALYGGTLLQPLAEEGYIPDKFAYLTKEDNLPRKASLLNIGLTCGVLLIWLIIPDICDGAFTVSGTTAKTRGVFAQVFGIGLFLSTSSFLLIIAYFAGICALLKFVWTKKIHLPWWETIMFALCALGLVIPEFYYFYSIYQSLHDGFMSSPLGINDIIAGVIELFFVLLVTVVILVIYRFYYLPKYRLRLQTNPGRQKQLNADFVVTDDWRYTGLIIARQLTSYLQRNQNVYGDQTNPNHKLVAGLRAKITTSLSAKRNN